MTTSPATGPKFEPMKLLQRLISIVLIALLPATACAIDDSSKPTWGHPNHGLTSGIAITGRQFAAGKPILLSYTVQNLTKKPVRIWHSGFWPNHQLRVCDQNGKLATLRPFGQERFNAFSPGGERRKNFPVEIAPGEEDKSDGEMQDIAQLYDLSAPGIYSVQVLYEEYQGGWEGQLWSNIIIIQIVAQ